MAQHNDLFLNNPDLYNSFFLLWKISSRSGGLDLTFWYYGDGIPPTLLYYYPSIPYPLCIGFRKSTY